MPAAKAVGVNPSFPNPDLDAFSISSCEYERDHACIWEVAKFHLPVRLVKTAMVREDFKLQVRADGFEFVVRN
jgi:hypothetical protein